MRLSIIVSAALLMGFAASAVADGPQSASGAAQLVFIFGGFVVDRYEFAAVQHDGRVTGEFNFRSRTLVQNATAEVHAWGDVICVTVDGNRARIGGIVRKSDSDAIPAGSQLTWSVTDNGEGKDSQPDTASPLLGVVDATAFCAAGLPYPEFAVGKGNIQVRP